MVTRIRIRLLSSPPPLLAPSICLRVSSPMGLSIHCKTAAHCHKPLTFVGGRDLKLHQQRFPSKKHKRLLCVTQVGIELTSKQSERRQFLPTTGANETKRTRARVRRKHTTSGEATTHRFSIPHNHFLGYEWTYCQVPNRRRETHAYR